MNRTDELRELLDLGPEDRLSEPQVVERPASGVGLGYAAAALVEDVEAESRAHPDWTEVAVSLPARAKLRRWDHNAGVYRVDGFELTVLRGGAAASGEGWLVDARQGEVLARGIGQSPESGAACEFAVSFGETLQVWEVQRGPDPALLRAVVHGRAAALPDPASILLPGETEPWLRDCVSALRAQGGPYRDLAALGLVARLWRPVTREGIHSWKDATLRGETPMRRFASWVRRAPPSLFDGALSGIGAEVATLIDDLDAIAEVAPPVAAERILAFLHARDDLESAALGFRFAERDGADEVVRNLDRDATARVDFLLEAGPFDDSRLFRAATVCPDGWWTAFAGRR